MSLERGIYTVMKGSFTLISAQPNINNFLKSFFPFIFIFLELACGCCLYAFLQCVLKMQAVDIVT